MKISTSMLSVTEKKKEKMKLLNESITDYFHLDVMDGQFVTNNTIEQMDYLLKENSKPLEIHLMVEDVMAFIEKYKDYQPEYITFHLETSIDFKKTIDFLHQLKIKAGIAINPETDVTEVLPLLPFVDLVLVMSVNPGQGGQSFLKESISKIEWLKKMRFENNYTYQIEVDGGINKDTISYVKEADMIVSGSYITSGDFNENIWQLKDCK